MVDEEKQKPSEDFSQETLKQAMKAFKKRLKLTSMDKDSRLGCGPFSGGHTGVCAIQLPDRFSPAVWEELCRQGKLRRSGRGLYELPQP